MQFKSVRALSAASMLLIAVSCQGPSLITPEPIPTPSPTANPTPTQTPTPTITPSPMPRQLILGMKPSPDGQWLAVVDDIGVRVYETASYRAVWRAPVTGMLDDLRKNQVQIAWTDDSMALTVSISQELLNTAPPGVSHLSRFDAASGELLWQQSFEGSAWVTLAPDGNHFLLMSHGLGTADLWDGLVPERTGALELPQYAILSLLSAANWSPDGLFIAGKLQIGSPTQAVEIIEGVISLSAGNPTYEPSTFVWDAVTGKLVAKLRDWRQNYNFDNLGWSRDGSYLISDENGRFILWDTQAWAYQSQIVYETPFNMGSIALSPDGTKLMSLLYHVVIDPGRQFAIHVWEMPSGKHLPAAGGALPAGNVPVDLVGWMPDGNAFVYRIDGDIVTLDVNQGQVSEPFPIPDPDWKTWWPPNNTFYLDYYQLSPDGKHIYFVEPQAVVVYDAQSGDVVARLTD